RLLRPPRPTLFPYTTLFRSTSSAASSTTPPPRATRPWPAPTADPAATSSPTSRVGPGGAAPRSRRRSWPGSSPVGSPTVPPQPRSEEHTSELQSRENLVCRL